MNGSEMTKKEMLRKTLQLAVIGAALCMVVCNLIAIAISAWRTGEASVLTASFVEKIGNPASAMAVQTLLCGIFGAVCFAGIMVYYSDRIGLLWATFIHWAMIVASFMPIGICLGWIPFTVKGTGIMAGIQTIGFIIIWLIMDAKYRIEVRDLNALLQKCEATG